MFKKAKFWLTIHPSVNAAYKAKAQQLNVSRTAVDEKLNGVEPSVSAALLKETAAELEHLIEHLGGKQPRLLPGYRVRILDGNCLEGTDYRLEVLRAIGAKALPGKSLVVLDPELRLGRVCKPQFRHPTQLWVVGLFVKKFYITSALPKNRGVTLSEYLTKFKIL